LHGEDEFKAAHLGILQITKSLGDKLSALDFVELHSKPVSNIVCFTVAGRNDEQFVDYVVRLLEDGGWSIGKVKISDRYYLRICVMRDLLGVEGVATFIEFFKSSVGDLVSMDAVI
jgi:glutamate/tyrosine decarboxylase-like PLP-dependent enzyme